MYFKIGHLQKLAPAVVMVVYMQTEVPVVTPVRLSSIKSTCPFTTCTAGRFLRRS